MTRWALACLLIAAACSAPPAAPATPTEESAPTSIDSAVTSEPDPPPPTKRSIAGRVVENGRPVIGATVAVATQLMVADSIAPRAGAGAVGEIGVVRATTVEDGRFGISDLRKGELVIVAEHPEHGRSRPVRLTAEASGELTLELVPVGAVMGTVTRSGKVAARVIVIATPSENRAQIISTQTDDSGIYYLRNLAEGRYEVAALSGGAVSQDSVTRSVTVKGGVEHTLDLALNTGPLTLAIDVKPKPGATLDGAQLFLFRGTVEIRSGREVREAFLAASQAAMSFWFAGNDVTFSNLRPGKVTLCSLPITGSLSDSAFMQRLQDNADRLAVLCQPVELAKKPLVRRIEVELPSMKPLPN